MRGTKSIRELLKSRFGFKEQLRKRKVQLQPPEKGDPVAPRKKVKKALPPPPAEESQDSMEEYTPSQTPEPEAPQEGQRPMLPAPSSAPAEPPTEAPRAEDVPVPPMDENEWLEEYRHLPQDERRRILQDDVPHGIKSKGGITEEDADRAVKRLRRMPVTAARIHRAPRKRLQRPPKMVSRSRLSILIGKDPASTFIVNEKDAKVAAHPRRRASFEWRGLTMFYRTEDPSKPTEVFVELPDGIHGAMLTTSEAAEFQQMLTYPPLDKNNKWFYVSYFDASLGKESDGKSQLGAVHFLTTAAARTGPAAAAPVEFSTNKSSRVLRSSMSAEARSMSICVDRHLYGRLVIDMMLYGYKTLDENWRTTMGISGGVVTDAKSLYDHMRTTGQIPTERQTMLGLMVARDHLESGAYELFWVPTHRQHADGLTKKMKNILWEIFCKLPRISLKETEDERKLEEHRKGLRKAQRQRRKDRMKGASWEVLEDEGILAQSLQAIQQSRRHNI
ncbi:Transposon Ty1-ML2 Gag-Pol polyprotein [Durusdinium trenchii]|uniref:Transposon Ty1-ML2 Gag-Pol polyprotein n=1 Tax=Durusdinium trenchii TaxID=1381693 RepID=A0ABP0LE69_9DINO